MSQPKPGHGVKSAKAVLNPQRQNAEAINRVVGNILGRGGCGTCGRVAIIHVEFQGDPGPDLTKEGVISFETAGG